MALFSIQKIKIWKKLKNDVYYNLQKSLSFRARLHFYIEAIQFIKSVQCYTSTQYFRAPMIKSSGEDNDQLFVYGVVGTSVRVRTVLHVRPEAIDNSISGTYIEKRT